MATRSRPAQGVNSLPRKSPRAAYKPDAAPVVVSSGSVSHPKDTRWGKLKRLTTDRTPTIIQD